MTHYTGQALRVELDGVMLPGIREVTIPEEHPAPDTTHTGDAHGQGIEGKITYHNGMLLFVDQSGMTSWNALAAGTVGEMVVYPEGKVDGKRTITLDVVLTKRERLLDFSNAVTFTVTLSISSYVEGVYLDRGPWYLGPWPDYDPAIPAIEAGYVRAAYQPKVATGTIYERAVADYAASLVNIAEPGVYDAVTGSAPVWTDMVGWQGNGTSAYLKTTLIAGDEGQDHAMFAAFNNPGTVSHRCVCGARNANAGSIYHGIRQGGADRSVTLYNATIYTYLATTFDRGVIGYSRNAIFLNGVLQAETIPLSAALQTKPLFLLCNRDETFFGSEWPQLFFEGSVSAMVFYKPAITDAQAAAVSWAMELIREAT